MTTTDDVQHFFLFQTLLNTHLRVGTAQGIYTRATVPAFTMPALVSAPSSIIFGHLRTLFDNRNICLLLSPSQADRLTALP